MNINSIPAKVRVATLMAVIGASQSGCYELQAAIGQAQLMHRREPIARVIADPKTPAALRRELEEATSIRNFASRDLGLPDNGSYRSYAALNRKFVVWNVFAAPEFSLQAKRWCYPFVGCVVYRGYFRRREAREFAGHLRAAGMDVSVQGVAAYSTLGHFDDPILSTMTGWSDVELASIIFHELTHQLLYVPNDTPFDEGLAVLVERQGVRRWLQAQGRARDLAEYSIAERRYRQVIALLTGARRALRELYAAPLGAAAMRAKKRAEFAALRAAYRRLAAHWGENAPFAGWFGRNINNADLASIATYQQCVPGFARLLARAGGDFAEFFRRVREIAKLPRAQRDAVVCGGD
ncbi:MAG TPA: aminopeptidase [Steroidobacteraceae bacterium]|nr:aminopeptidase [Steroidobacteraceae bacterium]